MNLHNAVVKVVIGAVFSVFNIGLVNASIIGFTGDVTLISAPTSVGRGALESDTNLFGFNEVQNYTLLSNTFVNGTGPGLFNATGTPATETIAAGTLIDSYLFHVDSRTDIPATRFFGDVTFDSDILGIIFERNELNQTDATLGVAGTFYSAGEPSSSFREFEAGGVCGTEIYDCATISGDLRTLVLNMGTTAQIDQIRVITAATSVPEPASLALMGLGLVGFGFARRKREV